MKKRIAIVLHNLILFEQIKSIYDHYQDMIDLYVNDYSDEYPLWRKMSQDTYQFLKENNYKPIWLKEKSKKKYDILLMALVYPNAPDAKYKIRYNYSLAKEKINYAVHNILFDYILCYGPRDISFLEAYSKTIGVGAIKFSSFHKKKNNDEKKTILYLPTYGEYSSIESLVEPLAKLSSKYNIIVKVHHGTAFLE